MRIELVVFDMAGTTINDDDGVNRCVRAALEQAGVTATREARAREFAVMRALGASGKLLAQVQRAELLGVGALAGFLAAIAAIGQIGGRGAIRALERLSEDAGEADLELIESTIEDVNTMLDPFESP